MKRFRLTAVLLLFLAGTGRAFAGVPHLAYGTLRYADGTVPGAATFNATITSRPADVLTQSSVGCGYSGGTWNVQCGNFASAWTSGDILRVEFSDGAGKTGLVEVQLTNEAGDNAWSLTLAAPPKNVKLLIQDVTALRGSTVQLAIQMEGLTVADSVLGYALTVGFDKAVTQAVGASSKSTMTAFWGNPVAGVRESEVRIGGFTSNLTSTRLVPDAGILVNATMLVQGDPASLTTYRTVVRILSATIYTLNHEITVNRIKQGSIKVLANSTKIPKTLTLYPGWNLVSLPLTEEPNTLPEAFGTLSVSYVFGYRPVEGPMTWDANRPAFLNDLKYLDGIHGYWIKSSAAVNQVWNVTGQAVSLNTPIPLSAGWNLIGYLPTGALAVETAMASVNPDYTYLMGYVGGSGPSSGPKTWDRSRPPFLNDLLTLSQLSGYWVKMAAVGSLVYPGGVPKSNSGGPVAPFAHAPAGGANVLQSNLFCAFWGVQPDLLSPGDSLRVYDPAGQICGRTAVTPEGGFLIYAMGDDPTTQDADEGAADGDTMAFTLNGVPIPVGSGDPTWTNLGSKELRFGPSSTDSRGSGGMPDDFGLLDNYPNPFNPETMITYRIPGSGRVRLKVFDSNGREIRILVDGDLQQGSYRVPWDGRDSRGIPVSSGIYLFALETGRGTATRKCLFMK
jgi:hypothetical protein